MAPLATAKPTSKPAPKTAAKPAPARMPPAPPPPRAPTPPPPPPAMPMSPPPAFSPVDGEVSRNSGKAVAAMVVGIVSCCIGIVPVVGAFLALPAGIVALVLGILGVKEVNRDPAHIKGKGMAVTGIVLGAIMVVAGALLILAVTIGISALEDYCAENPDTEGCQDINDNADQASPPGTLIPSTPDRHALPLPARAWRLDAPMPDAS